MSNITALSELIKKIAANPNTSEIQTDQNARLTDIMKGIISDGIGETIPIAHNYANDAAAEAAGIPVGGFYNNSGVVQVRLV